MRTYLLLAFLLLAASPLIAEASDGIPVLKQAQSLHKTGQYREAVDLYRKALASSAFGDKVNDQARIGLCHARRKGGIDAADVERKENSEPREVEGALAKPEKIYAPVAKYTRATRKARIQGQVITQTIIDHEGCITKVTVLKSLHSDLDQAVLDISKTWVMRPALLDGQPVDVYYNFTTNFGQR
jgi:TonB family protein